MRLTIIVIVVGVLMQGDRLAAQDRATPVKPPTPPPLKPAAPLGPFVDAGALTGQIIKIDKNKIVLGSSQGTQQSKPNPGGFTNRRPQTNDIEITLFDDAEVRVTRQVPRDQFGKPKFNGSTSVDQNRQPGMAGTAAELKVGQWIMVTIKQPRDQPTTFYATTVIVLSDGKP